MYRLLETIMISEGELLHIEYHNKRFNETRKTLFNNKNEIDLSKEIEIPADIGDDIYKCRIVYNDTIHYYEFLPYKKKKIKNLKMVKANWIEYNFKYYNRTSFDQLLHQNKEFDDILIIKDGLITDTSYCNVVFFDGDNWFTPASPLLRGTCRARLLDEGKIKERNITPDHLRHYQKVKLINAMNDFEDGISLNVSEIYK